MIKETWKLYKAEADENSIAEAMKQEYARISGEKVLIYCRGKKPNGFTNVKDEHTLTKEETAWIGESNIAIMTAFSEKHRKEREKAERSFLERFERELEKEREKMKENEGNEHE